MTPIPNRSPILGALLLFCVLVGAPLSAGALSIQLSFVDRPGPAPERVSGAGDPAVIVQNAARYWENAIRDDHTVDIAWTWAPLALLGVALPGDATPRPTSGFINFTTTNDWFFDPTPHLDEEFGARIDLDLMLGPAGSAINVGRRHLGLGEAAGHYDFFSLAVHEIGHILGLVESTQSYRDETLDGDIDLTNPRPFAGGSIPTTDEGGGHVDLTRTNMYPFFFLGERKLLTEADILAMAELADYSLLDLNPSRLVAAEPSALLLLSALGLLARRRRPSEG